MREIRCVNRVRISCCACIVRHTYPKSAKISLWEWDTVAKILNLTDFLNIICMNVFLLCILIYGICIVLCVL